MTNEQKNCSHDWATAGGRDYCRRCGLWEDSFQDRARLSSAPGVDAEKAGVMSRYRDAVNKMMEHIRRGGSTENKDGTPYSNMILAQYDVDAMLWDMPSPTLSAAPKPTEHSGGEAVNAAIIKVIRHHRLTHTFGDDECGYPLIDALTPAADKSVAKGIEEASILAWAVIDAIRSHSPTTPPSGDERAAFDMVWREYVKSPALDANDCDDLRERCWHFWLARAKHTSSPALSITHAERDNIIDARNILDEFEHNREIVAKLDAVLSRLASGPHSPAPGLSEEERAALTVVDAAVRLNRRPSIHDTRIVSEALFRLTAAEPKAQEGKE